VCENFVSIFTGCTLTTDMAIEFVIRELHSSNDNIVTAHLVGFRDFILSLKTSPGILILTTATSL
jgi:hypothetical protein